MRRYPSIRTSFLEYFHVLQKLLLFSHKQFYFAARNGSYNMSVGDDEKSSQKGGGMGKFFLNSVKWIHKFRSWSTNVLKKQYSFLFSLHYKLFVSQLCIKAILFKSNACWLYKVDTRNAKFSFTKSWSCSPCRFWYERCWVSFLFSQIRKDLN